jgi:hypothetical protein
MITLKTLHKEGLREYLNSRKYREGSVIPISEHRAQSHLQNPRAREEDVLLILAESGDELAGYLGILPDDLYTGGQIHHVGWMSCLWVDERFRGQKIAQSLVKACMECWGGNILLTEFTKEAGALYRKTAFFEPIRSLEGMRYYIMSDLETFLPPKLPWLKGYSSLLAATDWILNSVIRKARGLTRQQKLHLNVVFVSKMDTEMSAFIAEHQGDALFRRGSKEIQWILDDPWILSGDKTSPEAARYHFSSFECHFECLAIKVTDRDGKLVAVALITIRNGHLRIPYFFGEVSTEMLREIVLFVIRKKGIKTMTIFQKRLIAALDDSSVSALYSRPQKREFLMAKPLIAATEFKTLQGSIFDGDGDCAFT